MAAQNKVWVLSRGIHHEGSGIVKLFTALDKAMLYAESIVAGDTEQGEWERGSYDDTHTWENDAGWLAVAPMDVE